MIHVGRKKEKLFSCELPRVQRPGAVLYVEDYRAIQNGGTTAEQRGRLVDALIDYVELDQAPDFNGDMTLAMAWGFISQKANRDQEAYTEEAWQNRYHGYAGPLKRDKKEYLSPDEWLERELSTGYPPDTRGIPTATQKGKGNGKGNGNGNGDGKENGHGEGVQGEPPQYGENEAAELERRRFENMERLKSYK